MTHNELELLYLEDLRQTVYYSGKLKPKAINVDTVWARFMSVPTIDLSEYDKIWVWSDLHFGHKNIISYSDRPFECIDTMAQQLIENHNNVVGANDLVIWVGDVSFMGATETNEILAQLNGERILVIGNHDIQRRNQQLKKMDFKESHLIFTIDDPECPLLFTHYPMDNIPRPWINIHGHVHNNPYTLQDSLQHINVSVEVIEYTPKLLDVIQGMARTRIRSLE